MNGISTISFPLRTIRGWISLITLFLVALVFLDIHAGLPAWFLKAVVYLQFLPSLMKTLAGGAADLFAGFVLVLILTALFGRVYCSFLCPLGTIMDLVSRIRSGRMAFSHAEPFTRVRAGVLLVALLVFLSGSLSPITLLDPFSIFGREMTLFVRPVILLVNNGLSRILETVGCYGLPPVAQRWFSLGVMAAGVGYLVLIFYLSFMRGRLYCNTLCPVGTLLGLVSRAALFRLILSKTRCTGCGVCEKVCKAQCIDWKKGVIYGSRCVGCFNCISRCPNGTIRFSMKRGGEKSAVPEISKARRDLIQMVLIVMAGFPGNLMAQTSRARVFMKNKIPVTKNQPVTPPGSRSFAHFTAACTACYLCVTRCPGRVIEPGIVRYGNAGIFMPHLSNRHGFCNYECTLCGEVCPTGAILPLTRGEKKEVQVGRVHFIRENCIVITQKTECGACSEHCPTKAVNMTVEGGLRVPVVFPDLCVGCGACEYACPSLPHKSIYVEGNRVHGKSRKPEENKRQEPATGDPFPF